MALDKNVQKMVVVDGGNRDPFVGSEKVALYNESGLPMVPLAKHEEAIPGPVATNFNYPIEHGLNTMFPLLWIMDGSGSVWQPSLLPITDPNVVSIGENVTADEGEELRVVVLG